MIHFYKISKYILVLVIFMGLSTSADPTFAVMTNAQESIRTPDASGESASETGDEEIIKEPDLAKEDKTPLIEMSFHELVETDRPVAGLELEKMAPADSKKLLEQGQVYVDFRKNRLSADAKGRFLSECIARPSENPFCQYLDKDWRKHIGTPKRAAVDQTKSFVNIPDLISKIKAGDVHAMDGLRRREIYRTFKKIREFASMETYTKAVLTSAKCFSPILLTNLGSKVEEFFPGEAYQDLARRLYERSVSCADRSWEPATSEEIKDTIAQARFRASLIYLWAKNCKDAQPHLQYLSEKDDKFITRAFYWRAWCAKEAGNKLQFEVFKNKLAKTNPLSYHSIALNKGKLNDIVSLLYRGNSQVIFRTKKNPELNLFIRTVEVLQQLKAHDLARDVLLHVFRNLEGSEPGFQIYVALLAGRSGAPIAQFSVLSAAFQTDPTLISLGLLKEFYPLKEFTTLSKYGSVVDPYFLSALIRQESGFVSVARSSAGALGLMQLMPYTAKRLAKVSKRQLLHPSTNIRVGVKYINQLLTRFDRDAELALASYNAGPQNVDKWLRRYPVENRMLFLDLIPFNETRDYVALIGRNYYWYLNIYSPTALTGEIAAEPATGGRKPASAPVNRVLFNAFSTK
ncbi:MAG: lytic transglycosylase domain-containing protein [Bacteriovoracia bacterium]